MRLDVLRHSCSHIMAQAVKRLFKNAKLGIGPAIENGFYYDFDLRKNFTPEDLKKIEKEMKKIIKERFKFRKLKVSRAKAEKLLKNEPYKLELLKELKDKEITFYQDGEFVDLCKGPHIKNTGEIKAFKLLKVAGAYWKGDSKNKQLQRIYGTAFESKEELDDYLDMLEEAERRDHRKLGKQLDLFSFHEEGPGFVFWHPKGMLIIKELLSYLQGELRKDGYLEVSTPIVLSKKLWEQSGHWDHYRENMYFTKIDERDFAIKPMNCPGNILIYKERLHSYKELPLRLAEFGLVHRHELSGVLTGLFRVRCFVQDDAHIYCTNEQIKDEVVNMIKLTDRVYKTFGLKYSVELSTKPEKRIGTNKMWSTAEKALKDALKKIKLDYKLNKGEGAFYGPKIDFHVKDCLGRSWQCGTIQLDFSMPEKFRLTYEGKDGKKHRPVMLHRTIIGSLERFIGILIEHYAGKFPLWLAPVQVTVIAVNDKCNKYAKVVGEELREKGIRVELDLRNETVNKRIRESELKKIPLIINIGEKEVKNKTLAVRENGKVRFGVKVHTFISEVLEKIKKKV